MKAFVIEEPNKALVKEIDIPVPAADEVLIKVMAVGVCGTDLHLYLGDYDNPYPTIPGHEFSGVVAGLGENVKKFSVGQRVAADPNIYCEACDNCKQNRQNYCLDYKGLGNQVPGAFQQYMVINHRSVFDIGDLDFSSASMIEPLACVFHGHNRARPNYADKVLIIGAGPIGLMHLQVCKNDGIRLVAVADIMEEKLEIAKKLGADHVVVNDQTAKDKFDAISPGGFDLIIDCTGVSKVIEQSIPLLADEGRFLVFGVCPEKDRISVSPFDIYNRELSIIGANSLKKTFLLALQELQEGKVTVTDLIDTRIEIDKLPEKLAEMTEKKTTLKTLVYPNGIVD